MKPNSNYGSLQLRTGLVDFSPEKPHIAGHLAPLVSIAAVWLKIHSFGRNNHIIQIHDAAHFARNCLKAKPISGVRDWRDEAEAQRNRLGLGHASKVSH